MLCQLCLQAEAAIHVLDPQATDGPVEADYCQACYKLKYLKPPAPPPAFPRPRFTIENLMIFAGLFAIPNALVALIMRSGLIPGTPDQIRDWTLKAFLVINLGFATLAGFVFLIEWLSKVRWYKLTGGLVPMMQWRSPGLSEYLRLSVGMMLMAAWILAAQFLLIPILWPSRLPDLWVMILIWSGPLLVRDFLGFLGFYQDERMRQMWRGSSRLERAFMILFQWWMPAFALLLLTPRWMSWLVGSNAPWPVLCAFVVLLGGQVIVLLGLVSTTRRR